MTQQLTLKPIIKDMLERAGIEDVYDFPPSTKDCAYPIVIANETYERTDLLDDCEYGTVKLEVIVADITLVDGDLFKIVQLRRMSTELMKRLRASFRGIIGMNSIYMVLGIAGVITPQASSFLHNGTTVAMSARSARNYDLEQDSHSSKE